MTSKNSHRIVPSLQVVALAALITLSLLAGIGCDAADSGAPKGGAPAVAPPTITMTITVAPPGEEGRRDASVRIETSAPLTDVQLDFAIPDSCQRVAGAATRMIPSVLPTEPLSQGIGLQCPADVNGSVSVKLTGKDAQGRAVEVSSGATL